MSKITLPKYQRLIKMAAIKVLAAFLILYALADVSVLQAYCGNEAIGMPPADHLLNRTSEDFKVFKTDTVKSHGSESVSRSSRSDVESPCPGDAECFGNCPHIVISLTLVDLESRSTVPDRSDIPWYNSRFTQSDLTPLFHPPKSI